MQISWTKFYEISWDNRRVEILVLPKFHGCCKLECNETRWQIIILSPLSLTALLSQFCYHQSLSFLSQNICHISPHRLSIITVDLSQHYAQLCAILCVHLKDYTTRCILHFPELRRIYISILRHLPLLYPFLPPSSFYSWRRYKGLHLNIKRLSKCKYFFSLALLRPNFLPRQ